MKALVISVLDPGTGGAYTRVFETSPVRVGRDSALCELAVTRRDVAPVHLEFEFDEHGLYYRDHSIGLGMTASAAESMPAPELVPLHGRTDLALGGWVTLTVHRGTGQTPATAYTPSPVGPAPSPRSEPHAGPVPSLRSPQAAIDLDATYADPPAKHIDALDHSAVDDSDPESTLPPAVTPGLPKRAAVRTEVLPESPQPLRRRGPLPEVVPGSILGQYRVERLIGEGGMGTVFEASHTGVIEKRFAIKVMSPELAAHSDAGKRFLAEAAVASRLEHPHIVGVMDFGTDSGISFLVMDYLEGQSLGDRISRKRLSPTRAADIMIAVASGVSAAHERGITHRDLKPHNVFLAVTGNGDTVPKVLDFGIAKAGGADPATDVRSVAGSLIGTPNYLAPEQASHRQVANAETDQYALGAILYECLTGRRAHDGPTMYQILRSIAEADYPPAASLVPDLPEGICRVIDKAMDLRPEARFSSVREFGRALLPFISPKRKLLWAAYHNNEMDESTFQGSRMSDTLLASRRKSEVGHTKLLVSEPSLQGQRVSRMPSKMPSQIPRLTPRSRQPTRVSTTGAGAVTTRRRGWRLAVIVVALSTVTFAAASAWFVFHDRGVDASSPRSRSAP